MPTKYVRKRTQERREGHLAPPYQLFNRIVRVTPRQRAFLLFGGVGVVLICAFAAQSLFPPGKYHANAIRRAEGTIIGKEERREADSIAYYLRIEVPLSFGGVRKGEIAVDKECWDQVRTGDRIAVLYKRVSPRADIQIVECGRFALDHGIQ